MATKKLNSEARSGAALESTGRRSRRSAHGSEMLAEWLRDLDEQDQWNAQQGSVGELYYSHSEVRSRVKAILHANQQAQGEAGS